MDQNNVFIILHFFGRQNLKELYKTFHVTKYCRSRDISIFHKLDDLKKKLITPKPVNIEFPILILNINSAMENANVFIVV